ncbi:MAG TPA: carboxypeptidase-like regulatory domain-containing protein [Thermoanaerobaculia bacterium]
MKRQPRIAIGLIALGLGAGCASRPRSTEEAVLRRANPPAVVEGRVRDPQGRPVTGVAVRGLPHERDLGWSAPSVTDDEGRFRLTLVAPGEYGFLVSWRGISIVTPLKDDPARVRIALRAGEKRMNVELVFRREEWDRAILSPRAP